MELFKQTQVYILTIMHCGYPWGLIIMLKLPLASHWRTTQRTWQTLLTFCGLFCVILVIDGPLSFLDFLIVQDAVIRVIILHVHIAQPCLHSYMSNRTMLKHTSSKPCQGQWSVPYLNMISTHTSQNKTSQKSKSSYLCITATICL